jgi:ubiquinol-cytochrome c reductase cytochrome b subunit
MVLAILVLLLLPLTNMSKLRSGAFRPLYSFSYWFLVSIFLILGWVGQKPVESPFIEIGMGSTVLYFSFLLFLIPLIAVIEMNLLKKSQQ